MVEPFRGRVAGSFFHALPHGDGTLRIVELMNRLVVIDGLRGIGAVSIALYHIFRYGPLAQAAESVLPDWLGTCLSNGWMAVQWFFVMAGIGATFATRSRGCSFRDIPGQFGWRILRLAPVYWMVVTASALLSVVAIVGWNDRSLNEAMPTLPQFTAHLGFLQDILGYDCLTTGIWFIAIALQLEIAFLFLLSLATRIDRRGNSGDKILPASWLLCVCFAPLTLWSLFVSVREPATDIWFHHFFCLYALGLFAGWRIDGRMHAGWFWGCVAVFVAALSRQFVLEVFISLVAAVTIVLTWRSAIFQRLLGCRPLQYLGQISYSLFLVHYLVSWCVGRFGYWVSGNQPVAALVWLMVGFAASVVVAGWTYRLVERPALEWGRAKFRGSKEREQDFGEHGPHAQGPSQPPHSGNKPRELGRKSEVLVPGSSA